MTTVVDTGPLDWRIGIVDKQGRPTPEFMRRWAQQRTNNAAIGAIALGSGPPPSTPTPDDGAEYVDISTLPYTIYVGNSSAWHKAGVTKFTELSDVPLSYTGQVGKGLRVNASATGLEFFSVGTVTSITAGTGLSGGTITSSGTIALANTTVTPGSYTNTNLTVDAQGRITAASDGSSGSGTLGIAPLMTGELPPAILGDALGQIIGVPITATAHELSVISAYLANGLIANRPATPNIPVGASSLYYATDALHTYIWSGTSWIILS